MIAQQAHTTYTTPLALQQWGFRSGRSTVSALLDATHQWFQSLDTGKEVCAIFFDLRKAFDSVPHRSLLQKLETSGISKHILRWLFSYLYDREQFVVLNGKESPSKPVLSGVPQGSVLGPLLFLIYINDSISEQLNCGSHVTLYADDLLLYREISCPEDYAMLQSDVNTLSKWVDKNKLTLNASKCKFMLISRLRKNSVPVHSITLYGQPMERSHHISTLVSSSQIICHGPLTLTKSQTRQRRLLVSFTVSFTPGLLLLPYFSYIHH